jgi:hypothetical protein
VRERIEYRFRVPSAAVFTLYSYSKALEYRFRVPSAGSLSTCYFVSDNNNFDLLQSFATARFLIACSHVETVERFDRQYLLDAAALGRRSTARPVAGYLHTRRPGIGWTETREHRLDAEMNVMEPSAICIGLRPLGLLRRDGGRRR